MIKVYVFYTHPFTYADYKKNYTLKAGDYFITLNAIQNTSSTLYAVGENPEYDAHYRDTSRLLAEARGTIEKSVLEKSEFFDALITARNELHENHNGCALTLDEEMFERLLSLYQSNIPSVAQRFFKATPKGSRQNTDETLESSHKTENQLI